MSAPWAWARAQLRHRIVELCLLGLLAGLVGGVVLAAVAGARRTGSVYDRHVAALNGPDAVVATDADTALYRPGVLDPFFAIDGVASHAELTAFYARPVGSEVYPLAEYTFVAAVDERFGVEVNRLRIVDGRMWNPARGDEVVIGENYAERLGLSLGETVPFESWLGTESFYAGIADNFEIGPADGPVIDLTVVGVAREVQELPTNSSPTGSVYATPAFTGQWEDELADLSRIGFVDLERGSAGFEDFNAAFVQLSNNLDVSLFLWQPSANTAEVAGAIDAQRLALLVLAGVTAVAGAVILYAMMARLLAFAVDDQEALRAIGMTRRARLAGTILVAAPTAVVGVVVATISSWLGSALLPVGTPGRIEPDPGISLDSVVLVSGGLGVAIIVLALAAGAGCSVVDLASRRPAASSRPGIGISVARRLSSSAAGSLGVRQAFATSGGDHSVPARSTLVGCTVGIVGVAAALAFSGGLDHLQATPRLAGVAGDLYLSDAGGTPDDWRALARSLEDEPDVDELAPFISTDLFVSLDRENWATIGVIIADPRKGDPVSAVVSGRAPQAADEMTVGHELAKQAGIEVGDTVRILLADEQSSAAYRVVGINALPNEIGGYSDQAHIIGDSLDRFATRDETSWHGIAIGLADDVDVDAKAEALTNRRDIDFALALSEPPKAVTNLEEVAVFTNALVILLGTLAVAFLLHALAATSRRGAKGIAVLKALGFRRRQLRTLAVAQATAIVVFALIIGVPLGVSIGRITWTMSARDLGFVVEHSLPAFGPLWVVGAIVVANALALVAARRIAKVDPAVHLRAGRTAAR